MWKPNVGEVKRELRVLVAALRHRDTPWYVKALALVVIAYAVSPIDLIPDPIPVLGLLDDALLVPLGVLLVRRLLPEHVLAECRARPQAASRRVERVGIAVVLATWIATVVALWAWLR